MSRKELQEKFRVWAEVAGYSTARDKQHDYAVSLEHRSVQTYGSKAYRVVVIGPNGGQSTPFGDSYMTASEMAAALSFAIYTVYQFARRPELRK